MCLPRTTSECASTTRLSATAGGFCAGPRSGTFTVGTPPEIRGVNDSPNPVLPGQPIEWLADWTDPAPGSGVRVVACRQTRFRTATVVAAPGPRALQSRRPPRMRCTRPRRTTLDSRPTTHSSATARTSAPQQYHRASQPGFENGPRPPRGLRFALERTLRCRARFSPATVVAASLGRCPDRPGAPTSSRLAAATSRVPRQGDCGGHGQTHGQVMDNATVSSPVATGQWAGQTRFS